MPERALQPASVRPGNGATPSRGDRLFSARVRRAAVIASLIPLLVPVLFLAAAAHVIGAAGLNWLSTWGAAIGFGLGGLVCAARARLITTERWVWAAFAVACGCWTVANLYYAIAVAPAPIPLPSPADIGYFCFPLAISLAVIAYARGRLRNVPIDARLDAGIASLAVAALAAAIVFAVVGSSARNVGAIITTVIYPIEDVLVVGLCAGAASMLGWRSSRRTVLVGLAVVMIATSDTIIFGRVLAGSSVGGAWANFGWTGAIALIAIAAWQDVDTPRRLTAPGRFRLALPALFATMALVVLACAGLIGLGPIPIALATTAVAVAFLRLMGAISEARALADSRRLALTDELTGLPNRRRLLADLSSVCERGLSRRLILFDLDGFKHFNDTHGHPEGDALLHALGVALQNALPPQSSAYRLGGDEFCVLTESEGDWVIADATQALAASGPNWTVTASAGAVMLPWEASEVSQALRIADRRMYAEKNRRPGAAREQAGAVLLSALAEQQPALSTHSNDVTRLAREVARRLGVPPSEVDDIGRAAELHDIGKLAIPTAILDKPGPLDPEEWATMRRHTVMGERMLRAAPALAAIAPLVRSSHERWDGFGYPDGLRGEAIPLGSRIVAVCDAYDAMVSDRSYRAARSGEEALAELERCAGAQFDPAVVRAFVATVEAGALQHAGDRA